MESMFEVVADALRRKSVVSDVVELIDAEVGRKSGLGGRLIRAGYNQVKKLKSGRMIPDVVDGLLDEFVGSIEPLHAAFRDQGGSGFDAFLQQRSSEAVDALLSITDTRAERTDNGTLRKAYSMLRGVAEKNVTDALPGLGRLIDRHCA